MCFVQAGEEALQIRSWEEKKNGAGEVTIKNWEWDFIYKTKWHEYVSML